MTIRHKWFAGPIPALLFAAIVLPIVLSLDDLPNPMASHWGFDGTPNGHMPPMGLLLVLGGIFLAMWIAVWYAARRMPHDARSFVTGLIGVGTLLAVVGWLSVEANRGVAEWAEAGDLTGLGLLAAFGSAALAGTLTWFLAGPPAATRPDPLVAGPVARIEPGTNPVWSSRGRGTVLIVIGAALIVIGAVLWDLVGLFLAVLSLPVLLFAEVRATVSERGVVVGLGWFGIPSRLIPLSTIAGADVEDVSPMSYGGWGYRVRPGARAVLVRGGPSLRLRRVDRPDLVLTVDDAEAGAALVNAFKRATSSRP